LVQRAHVRVSRGAVEVEVALLHVLAVIPLVSRQAEEPLLENVVTLVPERHGEADTLVVVGNAEEAILAPAVCPRTRVLVGEVLPGRPVRGLVLPNRAPLPLGEIRPPALPVGDAGLCLCQAPPLRSGRRIASCHGRTPGRASCRRRRRASVRGCSRPRPTRARPRLGRCLRTGRSARTGSG